MRGPVVVLAGGTGGAKLARGMLDVAGADLVVIANTGDDAEVHGGHVSPDPDLVTFWLADAIDDRGWGIRGDTFAVMEALRGLGEDVWFNLGDRDLAVCLARARRLAAGERLTDCADALCRAYGLPRPRAPRQRRPGPHPRARRRRLARLPGVHDPRGRARAGARTSPSPARRRPHRRPRCWTRCARRGRSSSGRRTR